jgi:hypothetical protein
MEITFVHEWCADEKEMMHLGKNTDVADAQNIEPKLNYFSYRDVCQC